MQKMMICLAGCALMFPLHANAQLTEPLENRQVQNEVTLQDRTANPSIRTWTYDPLYRDGWSARALYESTTVIGPYGDDIGSVENIVLSNDGRVQGVIAEVGGLWDIGDTHLFIPWNQVRINSRFDRITVPVTEDTADQYNFTDTDLWKTELNRIQSVDSGGFATGPNIWKVSDVLGNYAYLSDFTGYGYVYNLIIGRNGRVQAVIVNADSTYGGGYRALPWPGVTNVRSGPYYNAGYTRADIDRLPTFDYGRLNNNSVARRTTGTAAIGAGADYDRY